MPRDAHSPDAETAETLTDTALAPLRERQDGWTSERQRAFLEVLADSGSVTAAAQAVGMTTTSAYRLRRRADARPFDAAWEAALERSLQRLVPVAIDRALNGTVRQRFYHGEMVGEERVYSDRLLLRLLSKGTDMLAHQRARRAIRDDWDGVLDDIEAGINELPEPDELYPWEERKDDPGMPYHIDRHPEDGRWMTNAPPPPGFDPAVDLSDSYVEGWRYAVGEEIVACDHFEAEDAEEDEADRRLVFGLDERGRFPRPARSSRQARSRARSGAGKAGKKAPAGTG